MATFGVITSTTNNGPAVTTSTTQNVTPQSSGGFSLGQSPTDLISFYGAPGVAQAANTVSLSQQLVNMGLVASGTSGSGAPIQSGTGLTLTAAQGQDSVIALNSLTGSTNVLPAATGSGARFRFFLQVAPTSGSVIVKVASATDYFIGNIEAINGATVTGYVAANSGTVTTNSDTVTLNRTGSGGALAGDWFDVQDVAVATWSIRGSLSASGTTVTPFSATV